MQSKIRTQSHEYYLPLPYLITMQIDVINYTIKYKQFAVKVSSIVLVYICMYASGVGRVSWRPNKLCINVRVGTKAEPQNEAERADKKCGLLFGAEIESGFVWFLLSGALRLWDCLRLRAYSTVCVGVCVCVSLYICPCESLCMCEGRSLHRCLAGGGETLCSILDTRHMHCWLY